MLFKRRLITLILIGCIVIAGHGVSSKQSSGTLSGEELSVDDPFLSSEEIYSSDDMLSYPVHFGNWITTRSLKPRPVRSLLLNDGTRRSCNTVSYHIDSQIGHQATCPFDWVVNYENRRIPKRIVEQVCRSCRSCGANRYCAQLKVRNEVFFRDTLEYSQIEVRAGCVCIPHEIGSTSNPFEVIVWRNQQRRVGHRTSRRPVIRISDGRLLNVT